MRRALPALLLGLLLLGLACGKYGPPVRASEIAPTKQAPSIEVPLPQASGSGAPAPAEEAPEVEEEPPPEGAP